MYYGWVVLTVATLGMAATLPGQTVGLSPFIDAFIEEFRLSRSAVSWLYTGATALFPPLMERGRQAYGWQTTYLIMGGLLAAIMLPLGALLYRDAPERYGLAPDEAAPRQKIVYGPEEVYRRRVWRRPDRP